MRGEKREYVWNNTNNVSGYSFNYFWHNACTGDIRAITEEQYRNPSEPMPN